MRGGGQKLAWSSELEAHVCVLERPLGHRGGLLGGSESEEARQQGDPGAGLGAPNVLLLRWALAVHLGKSLHLTERPSLICHTEIIIGTRRDAGEGCMS